MAQKTKKLSVKKETLRTLSGSELRAVAGGTKLAFDPNKLAYVQNPSLVGLDSSDVCQSGIVGGKTLYTCLLVATRCYEP